MTQTFKQTYLLGRAIGIAALLLTTATGPHSALFGASPAASPGSNVQGQQPARDALTNLDDQFFSEMQQFQKHMDQMFDQAVNGLSTSPGGGDLFAPASFDSSVKLSDEPHQYVVRFALPEKDVQQAQVTVKDGVLQLTASNKTASRETAQPDKGANSGGSGQSLEEMKMSSYAQSIALPGPVDAAKMQVQRKEGVITVTLPKAESSAQKPGRD